MSDLISLVDDWFTYLESVDACPTRNPGATRSDLEQFEEQLGFELIPEVRELFTYANGCADRLPLLPTEHWFPPMADLALIIKDVNWSALNFRDEHTHFVAPIQSVPVFQSPYLIAVECGPIATGAVWQSTLEMSWISRSLREMFEGLADYITRDLLIVTEGYGIGFPPDRPWPQRSGERVFPEQARQWRWESISRWCNCPEQIEQCYEPSHWITAEGSMPQR